MKKDIFEEIIEGMHEVMNEGHNPKVIVINMFTRAQLCADGSKQYVIHRPQLPALLFGMDVYTSPLVPDNIIIYLTETDLAMMKTYREVIRSRARIVGDISRLKLEEIIYEMSFKMFMFGK